MTKDKIIAGLRQVQEALEAAHRIASAYSMQYAWSREFDDSVMSLKQLHAIIAAVEEQQNTITGLREDLRQLIRVVLTNPTDAAGFVQANYHKEYTELAKHA